MSWRWERERESREGEEGREGVRDKFNLVTCCK